VSLNDGAQKAAGAFLPRLTRLLSAEEIVSLHRGLCGSTPRS
jgi:hypothetical protein